MKDRILIVGGNGYIKCISTFFYKKKFKITSLDNLLYKQKKIILGKNLNIFLKIMIFVINILHIH